ncbi:SseB family protein [Allonocardiopsis opalescens]|uniref:Type III secretion system (T3SS) SseB-like protein n=1 Tax=Allonocardiopsis opalescens TaxID=1144618 RepID=A0A2T0PUE3_9ACTN|nr:SseB family protein [Allonocardiopsis opalescens]PRX92510.1 type III secretion system (T3SS) SseB-like protein [Allonocardiopsis opalescens]
MPFPANDVERALESALADASAPALSALLPALATAPLWLPLPADGDDGSEQVTLPTVEFDGTVFVPVFTSPEQLAEGSPGTPYALVRGFQLARLLDDGLGIALNPGARAATPLYPEGVRALAAAPVDEEALEDLAHFDPYADMVDPERELAAPEPAAVAGLRAAAVRGFAALPGVLAARDAWVAAGPGMPDGSLILGVTLAEGGEGAEEPVLAAVREAVGAARPDYPVDVAFLDPAAAGGCGAADCCGGDCGSLTVGDWMLANREPFYRR